jgi:hypothetical protein
MNEKALAEFLTRVPVHLRFWFEAPPGDLEAEEMVEFMRDRCGKARMHRAELTAHGLPADRFIADMEKTIRELAGANAVVEQAEEEYLQAKANTADAEYDMFRACQKALAEAEKDDPADPHVQEMRKGVEELAKHFPKE